VLSKATVYSPVLLLCVIASTPSAAELESQKHALAVIQSFADDFCQSIPLEGHSNSIELSGDGKVKLNNLLKQLADLGIDGTAKYSSVEYKGVLQADLAKIVAAHQKCRDDVFLEFSSRLIPDAPPAPNLVPQTADLLAQIDFSLLRREIQIPSIGPSNAKGPRAGVTARVHSYWFRVGYNPLHWRSSWHL